MLSVGQKIPDNKIHNIFNYEFGEVSLAEFGSKRILLEFWNHTCVSCIQSFPKLNELQKEFGASIQIFLVNRESKDSTARFFAKRKNIQLPDIPFITTDSVFTSYFKPPSYPFSIWIDTGMIVRKKGSGSIVTRENILSFIAGHSLNVEELAHKKKFQGPVLAKENPEWRKNYFYFSYISKCIDTIDVGYSNGSKVLNSGSVRISENCASIVELYKKAYSEGGKYNFDLKGTFILEADDPGKFIKPMEKHSLMEWQKENSYNYDLMLPVTRRAGIYKIMQSDLGRFFGLDAKIVKKKIKCLVLVEAGNIAKLKAEPAKPIDMLRMSTYLMPVDDSARSLVNVPFGVFFDRLKGWFNYHIKMPFVNNVDYTGNVTLSISGKAIDDLDIKKIKSDLRKYNIDIVEKFVEMEVLVLKQPSPQKD
jgi:thiol-disulfide isomerase/thioredoxin